MSSEKVLLVGDNPFQGVSHLSQEQAILRGKSLTEPCHAAELVLASVESGADGFMFTLNKTTLSMLQILSRRKEFHRLQLYALAPDVNEFVRTVAFAGGVLGLGRNLAKEIVLSRNWRAILSGVKGGVTVDPAKLLRSYLYYEVDRLRAAAGRDVQLVSLLLHETVCDMALALNMEWLFQEQIDFTKNLQIKPGFETRNLPYLVQRLKEWRINPQGVVIAAPFNAMGFQMCPSREKSEDALAQVPEAEVIAFSILASGYLKLPGAIEYIKHLPGLRGVAIGVSREQQARETFTFLREVFSG